MPSPIIVNIDRITKTFQANFIPLRNPIEAVIVIIPVIIIPTGTKYPIESEGEIP